MRQPARRSSNAWGNGRTCAENLGVDATRRDAPGCEASSQIAHEGRRAANIEIAIARQAQLLEHSHVQASGSVEIYTGPILGIGRAVSNVAVAVGQHFEQAARLLGKRMFAATTGPV